ncbi:MAG: flippase [Candidatus Tritonobacter lacicola]|nr:flippase [Candidatus Tritonobacter lacicola]
MSTAQRVIKNTFLLVIARLTGQLSSLVYFAVIAHFLGVRDFGTYALIMALYAIFQMLSFFGMHNYLVREVSRDKEKAGAYLANSILAKLFLVIPVFVIMVASVHFLNYPPIVIRCTLALGIALLMDTLSHVFDSFFQAYERMGFLTLISFLTSCVILAAGCSVLYFGGGVMALVWVFIFSRGFYFVISFLFLYRYIVRPRVTFELSAVRAILRATTVFAGASILAALFQRVDTIMISKFWGEGEVGLYNAAYKLMQSGWIFILAFMVSVYPIFSRHYSEGKAGISNIFSLSVKCLVSLFLPVAVIASILSVPIITTVFGEEFTASAAILAIIVWALIPFSVEQASGRVLFAAGEQRIVLRTLVIGTLSNVVLNLLLIPRYMAIGAAVATVASISVVMVLNLSYLLNRLVKVNMVGVLLKPSFAVFLSWFLARYMIGLERPFLLATAVLFLYLPFLIFFRVFSREEISFIPAMIFMRLKEGDVGDDPQV